METRDEVFCKDCKSVNKKGGLNMSKSKTLPRKNLILSILCLLIISQVYIPNISYAGCYYYCGYNHCTSYCQPQCTSYARAKSGICCCQGTGSAVGWYNCEDKKGHTSSTPKSGRVCILSATRNNSYGHAMYVDKSSGEGNGKYSLVMSHANYDWKCSSIETNVKATYYKSVKKLKIKSGVWAGKEFNVTGFITQH